MSNEVQVPDYLKQYMDSGAVNNDTEAMTSVKTSVPRVSLKGKRFKFIEGEEESKSAEKIEVVILAVEPSGGLMAKTFYKSGYNPADTAPPDCASSNGISPDPWIEHPESDRCVTCPKNMFGSAQSMSGKKAKACKDSKALWVAKPDDIGGTVYGLKVPVTSLKNMAEYGRLLKADNVPLAAVITQLSMDQDNEYPLLEFNRLGYLNSEHGLKAIERSSSREWIQKNREQEQIEYKSAKKEIGMGSTSRMETPTDESVVSQVNAEQAAQISKEW